MLIVGTNSWVTLAEANAYLATRYGASAWAALPNATKEALLITAYNLLRLQTGYSLPAASTSALLKSAQCETAWFWYQHGDDWEKRAGLYAAGVRSFTVMSFTEDLAKPELPVYITNMLTGFYVGANYLPRVTRDY